MKKILIISELPLIKTFIFPTVSKLKEEAEVQFDCLVVTKLKPEDVIELKSLFTNVYFNKYPSGLFARLPKLRFFQYIWGLRKLSGGLPHYDIAHINFHHYYYAFFTPIIRKKADKLYITFFGSDFNQSKRYKHLSNKKSIALADYIFATNPTFLDRISKKYNLIKTKKKTGILIFIHESFEKFAKYASKQSKQLNKLEWSAHNKIIACGYNGATITRHEEIIKVLLDIKQNLTDFRIVFPMTYGNMATVNHQRVQSLLLNSGLNYMLLKDYLKVEKIMSLRLASDIFIHIQSMDQMSASMMEHLAAGSVVITGKWLPYELFEDLGVYFIRIDKVENLKEALLDVINNLDIYLERCTKNRAIILNLMSWEKNKWSWYEAYNLKKNEGICRSYCIQE
jgi:hypothetical protein